MVSCKKLSFIIVLSGSSLILYKLEDSHYSGKPRGNILYVELNQACNMLGPFRQFSVDFIFFWLGHKKRLWRFYLLTTVVILMKNGWRHLHQMWLERKSHFVKVVNKYGWWMVLSTIEGQTVDCYPLRQSEELDYAGWVKSEKSEWGCRVEEAVSPERERESVSNRQSNRHHMADTVPRTKVNIYFTRLSQLFRWSHYLPHRGIKLNCVSWIL